MGVETIDLVALARRDIVRWRELAARAVEPNLVFEPEYLLPLARALGHEAAVRLVVVRSGNDWDACLPVYQPAQWHRIPLRSVVTWRGGAFHDTPLLGTPLIAPERSGECLTLLLEGMRRLDHRARFAALEVVANDHRFSRPLTTAIELLSPAPVVFNRFERAAFVRDDGAEAPRPIGSSSSRQELRRTRRRLSEALGGEVEVVDCSGELAAVDRFIELESRGWKGRAGTSLLAEGHDEFFAEMCRGFTEQGRLEVLELRCAGHLVASVINLVSGDTMFGLRQTYDEEFAAYSPGMQLFAEVLTRFQQDPRLRFFDSCANHDNPVFNRLLPDRRQLVTLALPAPGHIGRTVRPVLAAAQLMRHRRRAWQQRPSRPARRAPGAR